MRGVYRIVGILWLLCTGPLSAFADCSPAETSEPSESDYELSPPSPEMIWVRQGLILRQVPLPEPEQGLQERLQQLRCQGCAQSGVRYADTAAMGPAMAALSWPDAVSRLATVAAMSDDPQTARDALAEARVADELDHEQRAILLNQAILTALQFGDWQRAEVLLSEAMDTTGSEVSPALRSDRLFWYVLMETEGKSMPWTSQHMALLDEAAQLDPESFQVRFWRLVGWISAGHRLFRADCEEKVETFVDIAFDAAQGSTCPLMMAHMGHTLERQFTLRPEGSLGSETSIWLRGYAGLNAALVGHEAAARAAQTDLTDSLATGTCAPELADTIRLILESQ